MAPAPTVEAQFKKDEKALCFHHELMYEAKIIEVSSKEEAEKKNGYQYKVHYKGWKNTWDDWVEEDRLRKLTPENRELANSLRHAVLEQQRAQRAQAAPVKKKTQSSTRGSEERQTPVQTAPPRGQKRMRDQDLEKEEAFTTRRAVRILMPDRLKSILVDDWENVTKQLQLVSLPAKFPASVILDEYFAHATGSGMRTSAEIDILQEVIHGLKEYFNKALGRLLLYRFEREQFFDIYSQITQPTGDLAGKAVADIYGGEHLLRLFVSMPELIAQTNMDVQAVNRLRQELGAMTHWLQKEPQVTNFFQSVYESPGSAYIEKVKTST
ncbi:hypothetical protein DPSP01_004427 [Paraphaeosphaeria sporulosa]|uniref:Chromatin modification-related protein EAF3 n=1 Tax=Paraphaeosphaeria sporulosa TaxID=1460663 RepID=A0A177CJR4_9PLEO|nr:NuA4 histone acetyltransferase complex, Eaf3/MRG15 subunit [Paraphaeosphaeria sporulosa]OAG07070.1 NuA4 histone acetyltransferase complex, Eaf3/MRG15 subunit [Paraphaeosphaeria sporulosa]